MEILEDSNRYHGTKLIALYDHAIKNNNVRAFVEKVICFLLRLYINVKVSDTNALFRLLKADVVKKYLYCMALDLKIYKYLDYRLEQRPNSKWSDEQLEKLAH